MKKYNDKCIEILKKFKKLKLKRLNVNETNIIINNTNFLSGKHSIQERLWYIDNNIHSQVKCKLCGKISKINISKNYIKFCSPECRYKWTDSNGESINLKSAVKIKKTRSKINPETGLTGYQKAGLKTKETLSKIDPKTGLTGYQKQGLILSKKLKTIDLKLGLNYAQIRSIKSVKTMTKIDPKTGISIYKQNGINFSTNIKKANNTGISRSKEIGIKSAKSKKTKKFLKISNNFTIGYTLLTTLKGYLNSNFLKYSCNKCGSIRESYWPYIRCTKCYPYNKSLGENEVLEFCESLGTVPDSNTRSIIKPLELDIYIPYHNLAIEYNGMFWHSSYSLDSESRNYHLHKTQECTKQGIQLFHIFENEWQDPTKQKIWKSIIKNRLGESKRIFARKTRIKPVSPKDKIEFLNSNHLQSDCNSSVNLGLYLDGELVSLMTFGKSRYDKKIDWELIRFCNKVGYSVVGGASKLLNNFRKENFGSIISYADKRRSNGNLYQRLGFELSHESAPNYFYFKSGTMNLESRIGYQKHKLKDTLKVFDSSLTESENMYENGYRKIYDCGNQVWILN